MTTATARAVFDVDEDAARHSLRLVVNRFDDGRVWAFVFGPGVTLARVAMDATTGPAASTLPEPYRTYQDAIDTLRDDERFEHWWTKITEAHPEHGYWQKGRRELADYLETIAKPIGSLAARSDDLDARMDRGLLNLAGRVKSRHCEPGTDREAYELASRVPDLIDEIQTSHNFLSSFRAVQERQDAVRALVVGRSDFDVVSVEQLRRILADGPGPVEQQTPLDEAMAQHELDRLHQGMAEIDPWMVGDSPVTVALHHLRTLIADARVAAVLRSQLANALSMLAIAVEQLHSPVPADIMAAWDHARQILTDDPEKAYGIERLALVEQLRAELDQAEVYAKAARSDIQRLGSELATALEGRDFVTEQLAETQSRLRVSEARRNMWTGRAGEMAQRIATLTSDKPTDAEYGATRAALIDACISGVDDAAQIATIALDAAWKVNRAPRAEDEPVPAAVPVGDALCTCQHRYSSHSRTGMYPGARCNLCFACNAFQPLAASGKTTLATIRIEFDPATRALLEQTQAWPRTYIAGPEPVVVDEPEPVTHASPGCACAMNDAGQRYIDPICRPAGPTVDRDHPISCDS